MLYWFDTVVIPWRVWQARVQECFAFVSVLCFDIHVPRPAWPAFSSLMSVRVCVCVCLVSGLGVVLNNPRDAQHHKTQVQWQQWFRWQRRGCVWVCVYGEGDLTGGEARPQVVKWRRWSIEKGVWRGGDSIWNKNGGGNGRESSEILFSFRNITLQFQF